MKKLIQILILTVLFQIYCQAQNNSDLQYDYEEKLSEGLKAVGKGDKLGYIDATGKVVIDFQFEYQFVLYRGFISNSEFAFSEGLARVRKNGK